MNNTQRITLLENEMEKLTKGATTRKLNTENLDNARIAELETENEKLEAGKVAFFDRNKELLTAIDRYILRADQLDTDNILLRNAKTDLLAENEKMREVLKEIVVDLGPQKVGGLGYWTEKARAILDSSDE